MMYVREPAYGPARSLSDSDAEENLAVAAESNLQLAARNPYDGLQPSDAAHWAAQGILSDLTDRGGLEEFGNFEDSAREEIVASLATIIRLALNRPQ
ncbi:hypothetical protein ABIC83_002970 [Roseateles asaccharophilus]|uniref:hypothetical protein n=1 Tax=Roseateles asaccharophilus TaxID=582607 RepID=UPI0038341017